MTPQVGSLPQILKILLQIIGCNIHQECHRRFKERKNESKLFIEPTGWCFQLSNSRNLLTNLALDTNLVYYVLQDTYTVCHDRLQPVSRHRKRQLAWMTPHIKSMSSGRTMTQYKSRDKETTNFIFNTAKQSVRAVSTRNIHKYFDLLLSRLTMSVRVNYYCLDVKLKCDGDLLKSHSLLR